MAMESTLAKTNWYPSGAALATRAVPVMPPPPPMSSTITCWPSASERPTARRRPAVSDALPAAKGTIMVTGRVGRPCADAAPAVAIIVREQSATRIGLNMIRSPEEYFRHQLSAVIFREGGEPSIPQRLRLPGRPLSPEVGPGRLRHLLKCAKS